MTQNDSAQALPAAHGAGSDVVARHTGLRRRTAIVAALTLVSRILGFVREFLAAVLFGDRSGIYDAFVTAYRVPDLFRRMLGEGALSTSLQNAMTEEDAKRGGAAGAELFWSSIRLCAFFLFGATALLVLCVLLLPDTMPFTGWHWLGADPGPVRELTARLSPFLALVCLSGLVGGGLMVRGHFATPSLAPTVLNLVWIAALLAVGARSESFSGANGSPERHLDMTRALCYGVLLAALLQLCVQLPFLRRHGLSWRRGARADSAAWGVLRSAIPLAFGAAAYQINVMVDGWMAEAFLTDGGPTTLYYANRLQQFPMALVAVAATTAVYPKLIALGQRGELAELRGLHDRTHLAVLFWALPAAAGLFALSRPIVSVLLEHGAFGREGVERTARALDMLCIALPAAGAVGLTSRALYAIGDVRTPVLAAVAMVALNLGLNLVLVLLLGLDVEGLTLGTALASWIHLAFLLPVLSRRLPRGERADAPLLRLFALLFASTLCGGAASFAWRILAGHVSATAALFCAMAAGAAAYAGAVKLLDLAP
jgi:putative peptidoglycan lipid II flippase